MGAAHLDTITRLTNSAVHHRTNPVQTTLCRPGGVAHNIACCLARLGAPTTLYCPPPTAKVKQHLKKLGVRQRNLGRTRHTSGYTAVLDPSGELEIGLADMQYYDRLTPAVLPATFPSSGSGSGSGMLILDAAFSPQLASAAAWQAQQRGWTLIGAGTSPAKVGKLHGIRFALFTLNEAEARALAGKGTATQLATRIAQRTGGWVAVTCGARGACLVADDKVHEAHPRSCQITDTTGAGDAFTATLAAAFAAVQAGIGDAAQALRLAIATGRAYAEQPSCSKQHIMRQLRDAINLPT